MAFVEEMEQVPEVPHHFSVDLHAELLAKFLRILAARYFPTTPLQHVTRGSRNARGQSYMAKKLVHSRLRSKWSAFGSRELVMW